MTEEAMSGQERVNDSRFQRRAQWTIGAVWGVLLASSFLFPHWEMVVYSAQLSGKEGFLGRKQVGRRFRYAPPPVDEEFVRDCEDGYFKRYGPKDLKAHASLYPMLERTWKEALAITSGALLGLVLIRLLAWYVRRSRGRVPGEAK